MKRGNGFAASPAQREKCREARCLVCDRVPCDPCHLIPRSMLGEGQDHPLAVFAGCRIHHRLFDEHKLDILPELERDGREELAFAVERFGLLRTLKQVTASDWKPA